MSETKDNVISSVYYDRGGFGSMQKTLQDAKTKDKTMKLDDVKRWFTKNVEQKKQLSGFNSFIPNKAYEEFQVDLAFFKHKDKDDDDILDACLIMIDTFSKYATAIPIASKETPDVLAGIMEGFVKMGGKPKVIYCDGEGSLGSNLFEQFCKDENIKLIQTRTHAHVAERFIRTLKNMINLRLENSKDKTKTWKDYLFEVLLIYNNKDVHSATKMTPKDAKKDVNQLLVKTNLELNRVSNRKYPELNVNDNVKLYKKKALFDKEDKSVWLKTVHKVEKIEEIMGQTYYYINDYKKPFLRHELLKVS